MIYKRNQRTVKFAGFWFTYWGPNAQWHQWRPLRTVQFANSILTDGTLIWYRRHPPGVDWGPEQTWDGALIFTIDLPTPLTITYCTVAGWLRRLGGRRD